jgi:hypothetical protein
VQGLLSLQTRPPWTTHFPDVGSQTFSPHCPAGRAGQVKAAEAMQTHCPFWFVGVTVAHLFGGQITGVMTQVPFKQTFGLQGSVETQFVQVVVGRHPGIGVRSHFPVVMLQDADMQAFPAGGVHTTGVLKQPATGSQLAVEQRFGGLQTVEVWAHCWGFNGSQALERHLFEGWFAQKVFGLRMHCFAVSSQTLVTQPLGAGGQVIGV